MLTFQTPLDLVRVLRPETPVACVRPERVASAASWFQNHFPGDVLYAVKANPSAWALDAMYNAGMRWFDVASLDEIELVASRYRDAILAYLHPIKSRHAIERAYFDYGVKIFALDCEAELNKILEATNYAKDLTLIVRMAVSNDGSTMPLTGKFGCCGDEAVSLLQAGRAYADELGVSFHVGSQCMDPRTYRVAMDSVSNTIVQAAVTVDIVDVGGGFPAMYPGMNPPELQSYIDVIDEVFEEMPVLFNADLWCEPGRALVADSTSIIAKVELVRDGKVYLNDGAYGNLFDAAHCKWPFPMEAHRPTGKMSFHKKPFTIYGPTCDSIDVLDGLFDLPADIAEGDYIEFGMMGAYGTAMSTQFNGFGVTLTHRVRSSISSTLYRSEEEVAASFSDNVIAFPKKQA